MTLDLSPRINTLTIGIRNLRQITIYPLSISQQSKFAELIATVVSQVSSLSEVTEGNVFESLGKFLFTNIEKMILLVTDPADNVSPDEFDNHQLIDLVDLVLEANYVSAAKKFQGVREKIMSTFRSPNS